MKLTFGFVVATAASITMKLLISNWCEAAWQWIGAWAALSGC